MCFNFSFSDSPLLEIVKVGDEKTKEVIELDTLHLECEIQANPPVDNIVWYFNVSNKNKFFLS